MWIKRRIVVKHYANDDHFEFRLQQCDPWFGIIYTTRDITINIEMAEKWLKHNSNWYR
jgi:hypothetical protein